MVKEAKSEKTRARRKRTPAKCGKDRMLARFEKVLGGAGWFADQRWRELVGESFAELMGQVQAGLQEAAAVLQDLPPDWSAKGRAGGGFAVGDRVLLREATLAEELGLNEVLEVTAVIGKHVKVKGAGGEMLCQKRQLKAAS